jgi:DNA-binding NtrC family response regulator
LYDYHTTIPFLFAVSEKKRTFANKKIKDMKYGTLLVIDDNPSILTALKICLGNTFERILTLSRPDTAPTLLQQEQVDLILLDMNFSLGVNSGQDGLLWLRTFRRLHAHIPVVLITAFADVQLAIKGLKSGAADFVTKPWDNDELTRVLKDAIDNNTEVATLEKFENDYIRKVVDKCHGNISRAAELLGITRQTLYAKLKQ